MKINLSNKTVLVTGGAGFIGSNLCEALLEKGSKVVCLDNFATGKRENLEQLVKNSNFTLIEGDIRKLEDCLKATRDVDYVLHQAALGSVPRSIKDPITSNNVNVGGFLNMLVAARDNGVKRFVFAASSSTYGDSESMPKVEDIIAAKIAGHAPVTSTLEWIAEQQKQGSKLIKKSFQKKQDPKNRFSEVHS